MAQTQTDVSSADWVGRQFVQVYYEVLQKSPKLIHRFYKPSSQLTITDLTQPSPRSRLATGEQDIQQQVDGSIAGALAKPQYIDAQYSAHGGVVLMVDGDLHLSSGAHSRFFQVFYLAPQEKGYYVHNDLLRITPASSQNDTASTHASHTPLANGRPTKAPVTKQQQQQQEAQPAAAPQAFPAPESSAQSTATQAPTAASHAQPSPPRKAQPPAAVSPGPQATSSWAALLKQQAEKQPAPQPAAQAKPQSPGPDNAAVIAPAEAPAGPSSQAADLPPTAPRSSSVAPDMIVAKNLPQAHLALEELEAVFSKFGPVARRGQAADIQIHNTNEGKVAYIKYSDPAAVDAATLAATVSLHGKQCEIKRYDPSQPGSYSARGGRSTYRSGSRGGGGRGSFGEGAGRGSGRGGADRPERGDRGPRGDRPPRGDGGSRGARSASAGRKDAHTGGNAAGAQGDA